MIEAIPQLIRPWMDVSGCSFQGLVTIIVIVAILIFRRKWSIRKPKKPDYITLNLKKVMDILKSTLKKRGKK